MKPVPGERPIEGRSIPLDALSERQRAVVQSHLPLLFATLKRLYPTRPRDGRRLDFAELIQEGTLALMDAVRCHDALRHGSFGPYAAARVQYAVARHLQEGTTLIRVPLISQRRCRTRKRMQRREFDGSSTPESCAAESSRHDPSATPKIRSLSAVSHRSNHRDRRIVSPKRHDPSMMPLQTAIRERIDSAIDTVTADLRNDPSAPPQTLRIIDRCHRERWTIPDPDFRTSLRKIAVEVNCSLGRVTRCEERFFERVALTLERDRAFLDLTRISRHRGTMRSNVAGRD